MSTEKRRGYEIKKGSHKEVIEFIEDPNKSNFTRLVNSGISYEEVRKRVGEAKILFSIGKFHNDTGGRALTGFTYRTFEVHDTWHWFDMYTMGTESVYRLWLDIKEDLFEGKKGSINIKEIRKYTKGLQYIIKRTEYTVGDKYKYQLMQEILSLPSNILNETEPPTISKNKYIYGGIGGDGELESEVKQLQRVIRGRLKDKKLTEEWISYLEIKEKRLEDRLKSVEKKTLFGKLNVKIEEVKEFVGREYRQHKKNKENKR